MKIERFFEEIQISARITNEATGVAFTTETTGCSSARTQPTTKESAPSAMPSASASAKPAQMRISEPSTAR